MRAGSSCEDKGTYNSANWVLLCGSCLLQRVVKNEVQKQVISTQCPADLAAALKMDKQLLVHELDRMPQSRFKS